jgi:ubiquinone/menaquinone biosynthesis C-methylase UbiE
MLWATSASTRVVGLNVSGYHARYAQARSRRRGVPSAAFVVGDAAALPFRESYFHKILALESAFHFETRRRFLEGTFRMLRGGGRLAIADVILKRTVRRLVRPFDRLLAARWPSRARHAIERFTLCPSENLISGDEYTQQLTAIGYRDVRIEDISAHVFAPFVRYWRDPTNRRWAEQFFAGRDPSASESDVYAAAWRIYMRLLMAGFPACEYVIVTAERPAA